MNKKKPGRPLKNKKPRIAFSTTVDISTYRKLKRLAKKGKRGEFLDELIGNFKE